MAAVTMQKYMGVLCIHRFSDLLSIYCNVFVGSKYIQNMLVCIIYTGVLTLQFRQWKLVIQVVEVSDDSTRI